MLRECTIAVQSRLSPWHRKRVNYFKQLSNCIVYVHDILLYTKTKEEHLKRHERSRRSCQLPSRVGVFSQALPSTFIDAFHRHWRETVQMSKMSQEICSKVWFSESTFLSFRCLIFFYHEGHFDGKPNL